MLVLCTINDTREFITTTTIDIYAGFYEASEGIAMEAKQRGEK